MAISVDTFKTFLKTHLSRAFHSKLGLLNTYTQLCNSILFLVRVLILYTTHDVILIYHLVIFILDIVVMRS